MTQDASEGGPEGHAGPPADLVARLSAAGATVATAESLTGGMLGVRLTDVPGSSRVYLGGVVAYAAAVKHTLLGVPEDLLATHGVVSRECAEAMARGARGLLGTSYGLATTGVAGPGPQDGHAAGTVWVAVAGGGGGREVVEARLLTLPGDRDEVRRRSCAAVLALLEAVLPREVPGLG